MNKFILYIFILSTLSLLTSCGEDRSHEYYELTSGNRWIDEVLEKYYLWNDNLGSVTEKDYFKTEETYLKQRLYTKALNGKGDSFSYIERKDDVTTRVNVNNESSYGFDFEVLTDPLGTTTHLFARILYVMPNSPASEAGLERGDWISAIDGNQLTVNNYTALVQGEGITLTRSEVTTAEDNVEVWSETDDVTLSASRYVEMNPFFLDTILTVDSKKIAYLVYNQFNTGPTDNATETAYSKQMQEIFARFKAQAPDELILDLRYNTGGYLTCAFELSSLLAPSSALGQTFCQLKGNGSTYVDDKTFSFDSQAPTNNLNISRLYVLTSIYTASASEVVINCLRPYFGADNVILVGENTFGKPVGMEPYDDDIHDFIVWPVTAYILNADGEADYVEGFSPDYAVDERGIVSHLYPLGDTREALLNKTLSLITGSTTNEQQRGAYKPSPKIIQSSLDYKKRPGIIIK